MKATIRQLRRLIKESIEDLSNNLKYLPSLITKINYEFKRNVDRNIDPNHWKLKINLVTLIYDRFYSAKDYGESYYLYRWIKEFYRTYEDFKMYAIETKKHKYFPIDDVSFIERCIRFLGNDVLKGQTFDNLNLKNIDLSRVDLRGTDFKQSDLSNANLAGADLRGADLSKANLDKVRLYQYVDDIISDKALFEDALFDSTTKWPPGYIPTTSKRRKAFLDQWRKTMNDAAWIHKK